MQYNKVCCVYHYQVIWLWCGQGSYPLCSAPLYLYCFPPVHCWFVTDLCLQSLVNTELLRVEMSPCQIMVTVTSSIASRYLCSEVNLQYRNSTVKQSPHYSDHVKQVPSTTKVYFITSLIRPPYYSIDIRLLIGIGNGIAHKIQPCFKCQCSFRKLIILYTNKNFSFEQSFAGF